MLENTRRRLWPFGLDMRNGHPGAATLASARNSANADEFTATGLRPGPR